MTRRPAGEGRLFLSKRIQHIDQLAQPSEAGVVENVGLIENRNSSDATFRKAKRKRRRKGESARALESFEVYLSLAVP